VERRLFFPLDHPFLTEPLLELTVRSVPFLLEFLFGFPVRPFALLLPLPRQFRRQRQEKELAIFICLDFHLGTALKT